MPGKRIILGTAVTVALALTVGLKDIAARRPPWPDSAVGSHKSVKPKHGGYWVELAGGWRCWVPEASVTHVLCRRR